MTRDEAKSYLGACVPGATDPADPRLVEALRVAEADPEMAPWTALWKQHQTFDRKMAAVVQETPVPRRLRARLAPAPPIWLELLRRFDLTPYLQRFSARWAAIAAAAIVLGIVSLAATREPLTFARYRTEVIEASWQANPHLEFRSTEPAEIKQWFKSRGFLLEEIIPKAITNAQVQGCRLIEWRGHRVAMLCLFEEGRGYHFFIADGLGVEYLPWEDKPDFEDVGSWKRSWKTIAWSAGDRTFVLAGMKYPEFTKRVYKDGAWQLSTL